jgi:hypothetical protein
MTAQQLVPNDFYLHPTPDYTVHLPIKPINVPCCMLLLISSSTFASMHFQSSVAHVQPVVAWMEFGTQGPWNFVPTVNVTLILMEILPDSEGPV